MPYIKKIKLYLFHIIFAYLYFFLGIDDDGYVANFTEIEQIIYCNNYCFSNVQIRGSVPVFWQQRGVTVQTKINRSYDLTNTAFIKHFE